MNSVNAQFRISKLEFNGSETTQANIIITKPNSKSQKINILVNQEYPSGTMFQVPNNTAVYLSSRSGNVQRLGPGSKHMAKEGPKGERHKTFFGKVKHFVSNKLSFYLASGPNNKYQGAVGGTVFTVEAVGKDVKYFTSEGSVEIQKRVPIIIKQKSVGNRTKSRKLYTIETSNVNEGDPERLYDYDASDPPKEHDTYQEAIDKYQDGLDKDYYNGEDPFYLADGYSLLGLLYLDAGNPADAIDPLDKSLSLWMEIDPDDPLIADHYLNLTEAHYLAGNQETGLDHWNMAINILNRAREDYIYEYNFFSIEDYDTAWSFGMDLIDIYEDLGYAYELRKDLGGEIEYEDQDPKYWYGLADDLDSKLK
jgi:hypothetical protein